MVKRLTDGADFRMRVATENSYFVDVLPVNWGGMDPPTPTERETLRSKSLCIHRRFSSLATPRSAIPAVAEVLFFYATVALE